ncbi:MAG: endopeptidase La [Acidobacteriota bacterium]
MGEQRTERLPMVPLREAVVFPNTLVPFVVGRSSSLTAVERALGQGRRIFLACQRDAAIDDPMPEQVRSVGTVARIVQSLKVASGNVRMLVEGEARARALEIERDPGGFLAAQIVRLDERGRGGAAVGELARRAAELFERYVESHPSLPPETMLSTLKSDDPGRLADTIAASLVVSAEVKQDLLERTLVLERLERLVQVLEQENERLMLDRRLDQTVKERVEKAQRDFYLSEKLKAIQSELGGGAEEEIARLREQIESRGMPEDVRSKALAELRRLEAMPASSAEATVSRTWLDWIVGLPWSERSRERRDIARARRVLDEDHHGLERVKERILEYLAVRRLAPRGRQRTILCFVGPPGVGKTSLARSIARATGRRFVRVSLGGVRDEAEIRGHRRTYVGAFPGRIVQMLRKATTVNPVMLLDELDKMSTDFRGDPSAALLEVLDPEQNHAFVDHYLDVEVDLSQVFFIATANVLHTVPPPLLDRLEVLRLPGYTLAEKLAIARRFLLPRLVDEHGLARQGVEVPDDSLRLLIERYTREAGVRNLERELAAVMRKLARRVVEEKATGPFTIDEQELAALLGPPKFRRAEARRDAELGVATGLAWTAWGGELLAPEVAVVQGKGRLEVTGQIGSVMNESARAALTYVRSRAPELGIEPATFETHDVHIHVPEGAIPKDGPSAGVALAVALVSRLAGVPARADVAMTGEVTLRGKVLPVGGVKEKLLAAHRAGLRTVILPRENDKDLVELPEDVAGELEIVLVEHLDEVLPRALERLPAALPIVPPGDERADTERAH